jgi:hypothetical protein
LKIIYTPATDPPREGIIMRYRTFGAAALLAAGAAAAIVVAPAALADDSCDPAVTTCEGGATVPSSGPMDFSPAVQAPADDYPADGDWFFSSPGPNEPAYSINGRGNGGAGAPHR